MKQFNLALAAFLIAVGTYAQTTWNIDKAHSRVGFSVVHMAITDVEGKFNEFDGNVVSKTDDFNGAEVNFTAKSTSIDTDNERRDGHLKSPDFFDAEKHPEIKFKGAIVKQSNSYKLKGDFTMKGVTKPVEFDVTYGGTIDTGRGVKAGFKLNGEINRQDYGLTWANKLASGELVVSDNVAIIVKIELDKQQAAAAN
jgi:polyisoprenoid-binding protein YceI